MFIMSDQIDVLLLKIVMNTGSTNINRLSNNITEVSKPKKKQNTLHSHLSYL